MELQESRRDRDGESNHDADGAQNHRYRDLTQARTLTREVRLNRRQPVVEALDYEGELVREIAHRLRQSGVLFLDAIDHPLLDLSLKRVAAEPSHFFL